MEHAFAVLSWLDEDHLAVLQLEERHFSVDSVDVASGDVRPLVSYEDVNGAPGSNTQASILPPPDGSMMATYVYPPLQQQ